jgi:hypothetical protein
MLAIAISLLFALVAFASVAVVAASVTAAARRARAILAELAEIERPTQVIRLVPTRSRPAAGFRPLLAAA